ncbi:deaminase, partial [Enterobacter asburiae]
IRPNEHRLSRAIIIATGDVVPVKKKAERVSPKPQDDPSFVLGHASSAPEAGARFYPPTATFQKGNIVWGWVV